MNTNCSLVSVADILLVDDNPDNLRLLSAMLSEHGYKIRKAINGSLALRAVEIAKPDLILLDINMPDIKGYEVCAQLKSSPQTADIPVIFISAFNQVLDKVKGFEVGGVDYISKPFDIQEVLVRVKNQLILRCQQKQLEEQNAQLQLLVTTTKAINEADDFEAAIKATLSQVCEKIGWNFGEFWIPNPDGTTFDYGKGWYASESCFEEFGYQSEKLIFTNNWTIPSKIYHSKQFLWLSNVSVEQGEVFLRSQLAKKIGLKTCFGIPIFFNEQVLAILVFFKKEVSEPEPRLIELVNTIATQLSSFIGRKRSESALRESQQQFAAMSANIPGAVYRGVVHLDGKISCLYVSEGIREITGLDPETLRLDPQHYLQMIHPQDKIDFNAALQASIQSLQPNSYEYRIITPSGKVKSVRDSLRCSRMENGDVIVDGVMLDISDRVAAQERLQLLDRAIGASSNGIVITDPTQPDNPVIYLNPGFERITGYSPGEILGKNCRFLQGSETTQPALNELRTALKEEKHCHVILRNYRKDGTLFWNEFSISPVRDSSGNLTHYIGVQTDITELKQAEEALRESEARFARLAENVPGVIYQYRLYPDGTDEFTYVSAAIRDLFELEPEAVQQDSGLMWASIHPDDLSAFIASLNHSAQTLGQWSWEWRNITSSGTLKWLRGVAKPQRQADGTLIWDGILLDISDRKQAESALQNLSEQQREKAQQLEQTLIELQRTQARLVQNEKMASLGQLVAGVAHEINNPVSFISCNISPAFEYAHNLLYLLQLYQKHYPDPVTEIAEQLEHLELEFIAEDFPKLLESMQEGANRIAEIVLSLRNFSRLDQSERKLADIHQGIDNTLLILQHRLKQHAKETEIQLIKNYSELPLIECYPGQLNQVFMNIISNAIDAIEESLVIDHLSLEKNPDQVANNQGQIEISTQVLKPNWIAIHIRDNGSGLTPEMRSRIFDPFFTTKPPGKGTGLGLSISYRIIAERHGGHLLCHSAPNQGTEFVIELPIHQDQE